MDEMDWAEKVAGKLPGTHDEWLANQKPDLALVPALRSRLPLKPSEQEPARWVVLPGELVWIEGVGYV